MSSSLDARLNIVRMSSKLPPPVVEAFGKFIQTADDLSLFRINPLSYATEHGISEQQAIDLFLHATRAGILEFSWGVHCPACKGFLTAASSLKSLASSKHCSLCDQEALVDDGTVEITFTAAPAARDIRFHHAEQLEFVRDVVPGHFSPSLVFPEGFRESVRSHVRASTLIRPGATATLTAELEEGRPYAVAAPMQHAWCRVLAQHGAASDLHVEIAEAGAAPAKAFLAPGKVTFEVHNCLTTAMHVGFIEVPTDGFERKLLPFLTAKRLVSTQTFRDLFRAESIPSGAGLSFKSMTLLFTDLKSSTELYSRVGDVRAYELVSQHFAVLQDIIAQRGGAMVKTIGDAIMATFPEPAPALEAAIAMTRDVQKVGNGELQLKVGLHTGPCIAVELNERLDYFGQTVNIAARVQGVAEANEICVTDPVIEAPSAPALVDRAHLAVKTKSESLKGVAGQVTVHHLQLPA